MSDSTIRTQSSASRRQLLPVVGLHNAAIWLLIALAAVFAVTPFIEQVPHGPWIESTLLTVVMFLAVLAVGCKGRTLVVALLLAMPAIAVKWADHFYPGATSPLVQLFARTLFLIFAVVQIVRFILHAKVVDANVLCAGLSGYLILGLFWTPFYHVASQMSSNAFLFTVPSDPKSMDGFRAFYFSFVTLSTVGYGDIVPVSNAARMLAIMEAISGVFYTAVLISRLVAIYTSSPPAASSDGPPSP